MIVRVVVVFLFLVVFLYGIGRGIAWIVSKAKVRMKPKGKAMEFLLKEHNFPKLLQLTPNCRKTAYIFVFSLVFYIVCFYVGGCFIYGDFISDNRIGGFITFFEIQLIIAIFTGIFRHLIARVIRKSKHESLISTFQFVLFFSVLPYLVLKYPNDWWKGYISLGGTLGRLIFYFGIILSEIMGFVGLAVLRKGKKIGGWIIIGFTVLLSIEILPFRRNFLFSDYIPVTIHSENMKPFVKENREFEFERSLKIIEDLAVKSENSPKDSIIKIEITVPGQKGDKMDTLKIHPMYILLGNYDKKTYAINTNLDSDEDGLSDFEEAELLSDAYNKDTDGDGINDNEDTDPLNPFKESDFGEIKKAIFEFYNDTSSYYLVENQFWRGEGEFANFNKHVVILSDEEIHRWSIIFGDLYKNEYGHENYNIYFFDKYWYYFFGTGCNSAIYNVVWMSF